MSHTYENISYVSHHPLSSAINFPKWVDCNDTKPLTFWQFVYTQLLIVTTSFVMSNILLPCKDTQLILLWCICIDLNKSSHATVWIYQQSKVINNIDICCDFWYWMMPNHTNLLDGYRVEIKYLPTYFWYTRRTYIYEPIDHMNCCKSSILYLSFQCDLNIIHHLYGYTKIDVLQCFGGCFLDVSLVIYYHIVHVLHVGR